MDPDKPDLFWLAFGLVAVLGLIWVASCFAKAVPDERDEDEQFNPLDPP